MDELSCLFHYGDNQIGSSGMIYFASSEKFDDWFQNSHQIRWAVLVENQTGTVVSTHNRPAVQYA